MSYKKWAWSSATDELIITVLTLSMCFIQKVTFHVSSVKITTLVTVLK